MDTNNNVLYDTIGFKIIFVNFTGQIGLVSMTQRQELTSFRPYSSSFGRGEVKVDTIRRNVFKELNILVVDPILLKSPPVGDREYYVVFCKHTDIGAPSNYRYDHFRWLSVTAAARELMRANDAYAAIDNQALNEVKELITGVKEVQT